MSHTLITRIPVFEGAQGKFYIVNNKKYSVYFPIAWAHEHITFEIGGVEYETGPEACGNCDAYGSIRGVFVGYCGNCLQHYHGSQYWRGCPVALGLSVEMLEDSDMWAQYPYMSGIPKSVIGDEEGADLTDQGVNLEELEAAIAAAEAEDEEENVIIGAQEERSITPDPVFFHNQHSDTDDDEEAKFDKNGRLVYPESLLRELDNLDRKGLLYSDGPRNDDVVNEVVDGKEDDDSYDEQSYEGNDGHSVYKNYFCEKCYRRHPKLRDYHCGDWQEGFMDC